jgi:adenosylmethionine-8-amino-7-oxononanoate aminotransferase
VVLLFATSALAGDLADNIAAKVLTSEAAQRVLSAPVEAGKVNSEADMKSGATVISRCSYSVKGDSAMTISVSLMLRRAGTTEEAKAIFLSSKQTYHGEDVGGLGDAAYRTAAPAQLNVLKGKSWLIISAGAFPKADPSLQEKAAREILKNLQD